MRHSEDRSETADHSSSACDIPTSSGLSCLFRLQYDYPWSLLLSNLCPNMSIKRHNHAKQQGYWKELRLLQSEDKSDGKDECLQQKARGEEAARIHMSGLPTLVVKAVYHR